jgi:leucyl aminopeptidase
MKLTFSKDQIEKVPVDFARIVLLEGEGGVKRLVRDGKTRTIELGVYTGDEMNRRKFVTLCRTIVQVAKQFKEKKIAVQFDKTPGLFKKLVDISPEEISQIAAENFVMAGFEFTQFKTAPKGGWNTVEEVLLCGKSSKTIEEASKKGQIIGEEINRCRVLSNTPGGDMTPAVLAQKAKEAVKGLPVTLKVLDVKEMEKLGMGAVLGVGKGSPAKPKFIILEYYGASKKESPVVLVGKGVTFDTGGLNIKPGDSMYEMHMDMSGGAAVIHAIAIAARLKLKKNVIALVPAVENMLGGESYRPGDILKTLSGKTIEILNTDAEGRVILADALTYAERYKPRLVVDVATLTGASLVVLGTVASAITTPDEKLQKTFQELGEKSGDYVWPLPLWDEYEDMVKGNFGDYSNIPARGNSRYAGVIAGGMFLYQFAKNYPWVHIDMAPKMTASETDHLSKGALGAPVRLLVKVIEQF